MPHLTSTSTVLAVVTHYRYERWLAQSLRSLLDQTRRPDAIVVVDDASVPPPTEIVQAFPEVTLMRAEANGGPYRLLQAIFAQAAFDAFMLQDADDWSHPERLALMLAAAERSRADMVGCQMTDVYEGLSPQAPIVVPEDPLAAALQEPTRHVLTMGTSLIAKALVERSGGLSAGLRFGADSEFTRRALFAGTVVNIPDACYFRRIHAESATQSKETGYGSPLRRSIQLRVQERARHNVAQFLAGQPSDLTPLDPGESARLIHLAGPRLRGFP
ncbi:hypothetical protein ASG52_25735 [Methylobacterium sp. Leaf456]|nr:hypothetical protein ASG52_25735 [Methylobacterium sp. Leaf456]